MFELVTRLARHHAVDVLSFGEGADDVADARRLEAAGAARVALVPRRPDRRPDWLGLRPAAIAEYRDPAMHAALGATLAAGRYDLLQVEYALMAGYAPATGGPPAVWTVHELGCARLRRELGRRRGPVRALLAYRWLQMLRWELTQAARFALIVAIAEDEARELRERGVERRIVVSPMGVDTRAITPAPAWTEEPGLVVFVGFFGHGPNVDAAMWLVRDVLPRIRAAAPGAHVALVGREPTPAIRSLARAGVVEVTGGVADLRPWLARAAVIVVPVREGGGVRGKVVEAWAAGRPVVSTTLGCAGLAATNGDNVIIADDAATIASAVARLLGDAPLRERIAARGRATAEAAYDWDAIAAAHLEFYDELLGARTDPARRTHLSASEGFP
jgi:glycosyltransferase involved in cell wall biosynthesis